MESAFGVDHGDIEKAFGVADLGMKMARGATSLGSSAFKGGMKNISAGVKAGNMGQMHAGGMQARTGLGLRKLGGAMGKRPGLAGGAAVGTAAVAAGAGANQARRRF